MKNLKFPAIGTLFFAGTVFAEAAPKTTFPVVIDPAVVNQSPYRFNGVVLTNEARGSGFCAWNERTFFSAAHVVYSDSGWGEPPIWCPTANSEEVDLQNTIQSRGYYRFNRYAEIVDDQGTSAAFGKDVILGFAFKDLIPGPAAKLNLDGDTDLRGDVSKFITGYPAEIFYNDTDTGGYFMHQTGPFDIPFSYSSNGSLAATRITTGPGNSGGPIWTKNEGKGWKAAGVLVGGLPSETVVYAFSTDLNALTRAVAPVIQKKQEAPFPIRGVSASTLYFPFNQSQTIPDGADKWSSYIVGVRGFGDDMVIKSVKLNLTIETAHRGDLQVYVAAPGGYTALLHNEQGAGKDNLVFRNLDLTSAFAGVEATGKWAVRVRDRLKGDIATLKSYRLEVTAEEGDSTTP
ncbi:MAG: proprotein convertase P-domain-containing protein [Verrucomicrobiota bacterium]